MGNLRITAEIAEKAKKVAKENGLNAVFVNDKGEFFTNENFARLSVGQKIDRYAKVDVPADPAVEGKGEKGTNDLGTVNEVVAVIEAETELEAVQAILTAEKEGKNRKTVIDAADKKIKQLTKTEE